MAEEKRTFKSSRSLGGGQKSYRKWEDYTLGDVVIGKFQGFHKDNYGKQCPMIKVLDAQFKDDTGEDFLDKNLVVNSCGQIAKAIENNPECFENGNILQFTYNGTSTIEKGKFAGKDAHLVEVQLMEEEDNSSDEGVEL